MGRPRLQDEKPNRTRIAHPNWTWIWPSHGPTYMFRIIRTHGSLPPPWSPLSSIFSPWLSQLSCRLLPLDFSIYRPMVIKFDICSSFTKLLIKPTIVTCSSQSPARSCFKIIDKNMLQQCYMLRKDWPTKYKKNTCDLRRWLQTQAQLFSFKNSKYLTLSRSSSQSHLSQFIWRKRLANCIKGFGRTIRWSLWIVDRVEDQLCLSVYPILLNFFLNRKTQKQRKRRWWQTNRVKNVDMTLPRVLHIFRYFIFRVINHFLMG
jgi:hypothetical protein